MNSSRRYQAGGGKKAVQWQNSPPDVDNSMKKKVGRSKSKSREKDPQLVANYK